MINRNQKGQFLSGNNAGTRFTRESSLGNQHAKGNPPNKTSFKTGQFTMETHPSWKGGIQKHQDGYHITLATNKRTKLARHVYMQVYGEIPARYVIYHLDGDKYNDDIDNLQAVSRAELIVLNRP